MDLAPCTLSCKLSETLIKRSKTGEVKYDASCYAHEKHNPGGVNLFQQSITQKREQKEQKRDKIHGIQI